MKTLHIALATTFLGLCVPQAAARIPLRTRRRRRRRPLCKLSSCTVRKSSTRSIFQHRVVANPTKVVQVFSAAERTHWCGFPYCPGKPCRLVR